MMNKQANKTPVVLFAQQWEAHIIDFLLDITICGTFKPDMSLWRQESSVPAMKIQCFRTTEFKQS